MITEYTDTLATLTVSSAADDSMNAPIKTCSSNGVSNKSTLLRRRRRTKRHRFRSLCNSASNSHKRDNKAAPTYTCHNSSSYNFINTITSIHSYSPLPLKTKVRVNGDSFQRYYEYPTTIIVTIVSLQLMLLLLATSTFCDAWSTVQRQLSSYQYNKYKYKDNKQNWHSKPSSSSSSLVPLFQSSQSSQGAESDQSMNQNVNHVINRNNIIQSTMDTALCIIPPSDAWDDIQRARHLCHDMTFYKWPPAIRLFHPFIPPTPTTTSAARQYDNNNNNNQMMNIQQNTLTNAAFDIASIIETYNLSKFNITLDHLLILPHLEQIEEWQEQEQKDLPIQSKDTTSDTHYSKQDRDTQRLIQREAEKGKQKLLKRLEREEERKRQKAKEEQGEDENQIRNNSSCDNASTTKSSFAPNKRKTSKIKSSNTNKKKNYNNNSDNDFNGPCILCLEPDEESQLHLYTLREILRKKLFSNYDPFSPSSIIPRTTIMGGRVGGEGGGAGAEIKGGGGGRGDVDNRSSRSTKRSDYYHKNDGLNLLPKSILKKHGLLLSTTTTTTGSSTSISTNKSLRKKKKQEGCTFRPLIVLGQFSTVTKAITIARKLQKSWEPLTFEVCDLQIVSTMTTTSSSSRIRNGSYSANGSSSKSSTTSLSSSTYSSAIEVDDNYQPILPDNREYEIRKRHGSIIDNGTVTSRSLGIDEENKANPIHGFTSKGEYGCDAMIMLMGEEGILPTTTATTSATTTNNTNDKSLTSSSKLFNDDVNGKEDEIIDLLMTEAGTPGGGSMQNDNSKSSATTSHYVSNAGHSLIIDPINNDNKNEDDTILSSAYIEDWLNDDDDDYDEGATIIIGRTQFFMGEMKQYTGMPASSTIDGKDRKLGDNVSGAARRRGAVHRQGDRWNDGDFGSKERDSLA